MKCGRRSAECGVLLALILLASDLAWAQDAGKCSLSKLIRAVTIANQLLTLDTTEPLVPAPPVPEPLADEPTAPEFIADDITASFAELELPASSPPLLPPRQPGVALTDEQRYAILTWWSLYGHGWTKLSRDCAYRPLDYLIIDVGRWPGQTLREYHYPPVGVYCQSPVDWRWYPLRVVKRKPNANAHRLPQRNQRAALLTEFKALAALCGLEQTP